jgi:large subunit ribosomal protein L10
MTRDEKQQVIETLKEKFSQYTNFYITDTEKLSVAQVTNLRRHCFNKQVEVKVAKNTLIKKALESLDAEKYAGIYDSLHKVTALMFSESPKEPALIISSFRKEINGEKPVLKAAFLNGDVFIGDNQLLALTRIKTKNELIGEVISLLQSPIQRVLGALQNRPEGGDNAIPTATAPEATTPTETVNTPEGPAAPETTNPEPTAEAAPETKPEA